jgi:peptidyl-prolyl cis-trans isomerase B (cyclophilin B)
MSTRPNPKRARKKERQAQRRSERYAAYQRRRRQRLVLTLSMVGILVAAGVVAFFMLKPESKKAAASPSPIPTPTADTAPVKVPIKDPVACGAEKPETAGSIKKKYPAATDQKLDPDKTYTWKLETSCGEISIALDVKRSPKTANSIAFLTREGFYDGTFFHRVAPDFVIQGGDPKGDGTGGPGYKVVEPLPSGFKYKIGSVAMAKGGQEAGGTSGSQFFIVLSDKGASGLTPDYANVGDVTEGMDVVSQIAESGTADFQPPKAWTYIEKATIVEE